jgi:hypothetical protein
LKYDRTGKNATFAFSNHLVWMTIYYYSYLINWKKSVGDNSPCLFVTWLLLNCWLVWFFLRKKCVPPGKKMCEAISLSRSKLVRRERQRLTESKVTRNALTTTSTETWSINSFFFFLLFCWKVFLHVIAIKLQYSYF